MSTETQHLHHKHNLTHDNTLSTSIHHEDFHLDPLYRLGRQYHSQRQLSPPQATRPGSGRWTGHKKHKKKKTDPVVPDGKWGFMGSAITITHVSE
jgi:hypothetical protein